MGNKDVGKFDMVLLMRALGNVDTADSMVMYASSHLCGSRKLKTLAKEYDTEIDYKEVK